MNNCILFCVILASLPSSINNLQIKTNRPSWQVCTQKVVEIMFGEETFYYIFNRKTNDFLPFHSQNPRIIINTDRGPVNGSREGNIFYNFAIIIENLRSFEKDINFLMKEDKVWSRFRSPTGKFLVLTNNVMHVRKVFSILWEKKIIYVQVVVIDRNEKSRLFTSNPQDRENGCGKIANIIKNQSCESTLVDTTPKVIRNYNRCPTTVAFIGKHYDDLGNYISNISVEILNISLNKAQITKYDSRYDASRYIEFYELILSVESYQQFRISHAISRDTIVWIVPPAEPISALEVLVIPFEKEVWILFFVAFALFALTNYIIGRFMTGLAEIILDTFNMTLYGSIKRIPKTSALRFMTICYIVYSMHIQTAYLSSLTRLLMSPPMGKHIQDLQELLKTDLPICYDLKARFSLHFYYTPQFNETFFRVVNKLCPPKEYDVNVDPDPYELLKVWSKHHNFSMIMYLKTLHEMELRLRLRTPNYFFDNLMTPTSVHIFATEYFGYFIDSIDVIIDKLTESGLFDRLNKTRQSYYVDTKLRLSLSEDEVVGLSFEHLGGVFMVYGFGIALSIVAFIGEIVFSIVKYD